MQRAIVTVRIQGSQQEYDLEVPATVPSQELADLITYNLRPARASHQLYAIECLRPGPFKRRLKPNESLADAGLWDGAYLVIEPANAAAALAIGHIVNGWDDILSRPMGDAAIPGVPAKLSIPSATDVTDLVTWGEPILTDSGKVDVSLVDANQPPIGQQAPDEDEPPNFGDAFPGRKL